MTRAKKPAVIRVLEGNRSRTPIPKEIDHVGNPVPPEHLTAEQLDRWCDIVSSLPSDLLSRADIQALERMAIAWASYRQVCVLINQTGLLTKGQKGDLIPNPLFRIRNAATIEMQACGMQLGLSPRARARIAAAGDNPEETDPLTILLGPNKKAWGDESIPAQ